MEMPFNTITDENITMILEFRRMFDSYNAELFVKNSDQDDLKKLEENVENMRKALGSSKDFRFYDNEFHDIIAKGTKNEIIIQISNVFVDVLLDLQSRIYSDYGTEEAVDQHELILKSIKSNNAELASIYSRMHIDNILKMY
ncbi:MAG TPA: FadR family transcriptional regulator [Clostridiales bacterium]|nr:FadR family transcriptional regulator [Clostridiales bacterium]